MPLFDAGREMTTLDEAAAASLPAIDASKIGFQVIRVEDLRPHDLVIVTAPNEAELEYISHWAQQMFKNHRVRIGVVPKGVEVKILRAPAGKAVKKK